MERIHGIVDQSQFIDMACRLKTSQLLLSMLLSSYIIFIRGQTIGGTWKGAVKGTPLKTRNGRNIEAFLGIPYAQPPIGSLRFRRPEEAAYWGNVRDATVDGNQCTQLNDAGEVVGSEDCLYLNVYTPGILLNEEQKLFPTMVYIHGGDFVKGNGSSTMYGPGYLLDKDIVLVTINYRLGVPGFLSTGDQEAPGNFGLKDQVLALQWVQKNIVFFRGDSNQVTLFGNDAGGVSAQLHSVSDLSDGLFKQYISQSGTASCFWAFNDNYKYKEYAKKLGKYLKCPTTDSRDLIDCLREVDIYKLVDSNDIFKNIFYHFNTWGPTNEPELNGAFLTEHSYHKLISNRVKDYPSLIGHVADEGLILTAQFYSNDDMYEKMVNNLDAFLRNIIEVSFDDREPERYVAHVKDFYFNGIEPNQQQIFLKNMTNLMSDTTFLISGAYMEEATISYLNSTTFLYSFEYCGSVSNTSRAIGSNQSICVTHGDELIYLFPTNTTQFDQRQLHLSESDKQMIDIMTELWTSFAYNGTPSTNQSSDSNFWQLYRNNEDYLIIGDKSDTALSRRKLFRESRKIFWFNQITNQIFGGFLRASYND